MLTVEERYEAKVDRSGDCHLWTAARDGDGYGAFQVEGRTLKAHRWGYTHYIGPIPDGLNVCHTCDEPACQRLDHLFLGTQADNMADRDRKGRQYRPSGENNPNTKLTEDDVRAIRQRAAAGEMKIILAAEYGLHRMTVSKIVRRVTWTHI